MKKRTIVTFVIDDDLLQKINAKRLTSDCPPPLGSYCRWIIEQALRKEESVC